MLADNAAASPQDVSEVAEKDLAFLLRLRRLGETAPPDHAVWGQFLQQSYDVQIVRRTHVRLLMSYVESVLAWMKADVLESGTGLSTEERTLLTEALPDISEQGDVITRPFFVPIQKNVKFTFRTFAKAHGIAYQLDVGGDGWNAFLEAVKIRNRITHPKQIVDMTISESEMKRVDTAHDWFIKNYSGLLDAHIAELERHLEPEAGKDESGLTLV